MMLLENDNITISATLMCFSVYWYALHTGTQQLPTNGIHVLLKRGSSSTLLLNAQYMDLHTLVDNIVTYGIIYCVCL